MLHWFEPDPPTAVDKAPTGFSSEGSTSEALWKNPKSIFHPILYFQHALVETSSGVNPNQLTRTSLPFFTWAV